MRRWKFETANFKVELITVRDRAYKYDGVDENGETQAKLDSGEYVAFESSVIVSYRGEVLGGDHLGGSVYSADTMAEFWTAHRDPDPMNRNCTIMRRAWQGGNDPNAKICICHYFPDMVRAAIAQARETMAERREALEEMPKLRRVA